MDDIGARLRRHHDQAVSPTTADEAIGRAGNAEPPRRGKVLAAVAAVAIASVGKEGEEVVVRLDGTTVGDVTPTDFGLPVDRWVVALGSCDE